MAAHILSVAWQGHMQQTYQLCQHEGCWYKQQDNYILLYLQAESNAWHYWREYAVADDGWTVSLDSTIEFSVEHCEVNAGDTALLLATTYADTQGLLHACFRKIEWERVRGIIVKLLPLPQKTAAAQAI